MSQLAEKPAKDEDESSIEEVESTSKPKVLSASYKKNVTHIKKMLSSYSSDYSVFGNANILKNRYRIEISKELQEFSKPNATAYHAIDTKDSNNVYIAYVMTPQVPYRHDALEILVDQRHPNLINIVDGGIVYFAAERANKFVILTEKPTGKTLQQLIENQQFYAQSDVTKKIIAPCASAIAFLHNLGLFHGKINANNVYIDDDKIKIDECVTQFSAVTQPPLYQPIEQLNASAEGIGTGNITTDIYSIAILTLDAIGHLRGKHTITRPQLAALLFSRGVYISLVNESQTSDYLIDLFRGCLLDSMYDRWMPEHLLEFARGKRYNLIAPNPPKEAARAHQFSEKDFFTKRALASALFAYWNKAHAHIKEGKIYKWLDNLNFKDDSGDRISNVMQNGTRSKTREHEQVSRVLMILDPQGAIRYRDFNAHSDSYPHLLAHHMQSNNMHQRLLMLDTIRHDLPAFWAEIQPENSSTIRPEITWDLPLARQMLFFKTLGFGTERLLYDMNPALPCLSKFLLPYYVTSATAMLKVLDALAKEHAENKSFIDTHMIAFLAAKIGMRKESAIKEHKPYPELYRNKEMQALITLAKAQDKLKIGKLPGLTYWVSLRMAEMLEHIHSKEMRDNFITDIHRIMPEGKMMFVIKAFQNKNYIVRDCKGHQHARIKYHKNALQIKKLLDKTALSSKARHNGMRLAVSIALIGFFGVLYYVLYKYSR